MNKKLLQNSTTNAGSNTKKSSIAKFFSFKKTIKKLFHHTKKHHKKIIWFAGLTSIVHFLLIKGLWIHLLWIKALALLLTSFGINHNINTLADFNTELVVPWQITITWMNWETITFENEYQNTPVVLATPVTDNNWNNYPIPTIRNITTTWFDVSVCVDKWAATCATWVNAETVDYFVFDIDEADNYSWIEVGTSSVATDWSNTNISFSNSFSNSPILWTTAQTYNQSWRISAVARVNDNQTTNWATLIWCVHQENHDNKCDTWQPNEIIWYIAIDLTNQNINSFQNWFNDISNSTWTNISFDPWYIQPRIMVTQNDDNGWQDPQYPWAKNITTTWWEQRYCEQDWINECDNHNAERVYWFAIEWYDLYTLPTAKIEYSTTWLTNQDINIVLTWLNKTWINITNNAGTTWYTFTGNWSFTFELEDLAWNTWEETATVSRIYKTKPTWNIVYSETGLTNNDVTAILTGLSETGVTITNNDWSDTYTFTGNWSFTFEFEDLAWNTWEETATVDRIDKINPTANISYSETWLTSNDVLVTLTWFSETGITITNNNWSWLYNFTWNWSFTFEFVDLVWNTWEETATVDRIDKTLPNLSFTDNIDNLSINSETISVDYDTSTIKKYKFIYNKNDCDSKNTLNYTGIVTITDKSYNWQYFCAYAENSNWNNTTLLSENKIHLKKFITQTWSINITTWIINAWNSHVLKEDWILILASGAINWKLQISWAQSIIVSWCNWDGNLVPPTFVLPTAPEAADNIEIPNKNIKQTIKAWANNCASLYLSWIWESQFFTIQKEILNWISWERLEIFRSSDGTTWESNPINKSCILDENQICTFQTEHLTYFAFGAWTWSFEINNNAEYTSWLNVILNNLATWATQMRFGNSISERNSAFWTGYATTYPRTLNTWDWTKTVYAEFSGGWYSNTVEDTIILDTTKPTATISYDPSTSTMWNVIATFTWFSETWTIITNNGWSTGYTFTENGSFTFEFKDQAGNTWETTATVTRIIANPIYFTWNTPADWWEIAGPSVNINIGIDKGIFTWFTRTRDWSDYNLYNNGLIFMSNLDNNSEIWDNSTTVVDISNGWNNGTIYWVTPTSLGKRNWAYSFDGTNDYIDIWTYNLNEFTISARFNTDQVDAARRTIIWDPSTSFEISKNTSNNIDLYSQWLTSNTVIQANRRYHLVMVKDSAWTELYIDWVLDNSNTNTTSINSPLVIGNWYTSQYRDGLIDEVKIYNYWLSSWEVEQLYLSNLQKINSWHWEFNTTQTWLEYQTYNYTGTIYTWWISYNTSRSLVVDATPFNGDVVYNTDPTDWFIDFCPKPTTDIIIYFVDAMNTWSISGNLNISPAFPSYEEIRSGNDTLILRHPDTYLDFETEYTITVWTWVTTFGGNSADQPYEFSFTTVPMRAYCAESNIFYESTANDWSISNRIVVDMTWTNYQTSIDESNIIIGNIPAWLTWAIEYVDPTTVRVTLSGNAINHTDSDDLTGLTITFTWDAFTDISAEDMIDMNGDISVDFLDPFKITLNTTKDTALDWDWWYEDYNYWASAGLYLNQLETFLLWFDLSSIPKWATIDSAKLSLTMYWWTANPNIYVRELYNNEWIEWSTNWTIANNWEPTFNQREYGTPWNDWYGWWPGLAECIDYSTVNLLNSSTLLRDTPTVFDINNTWLQTLQKRYKNSWTNYGFVITISDSTAWSTYLATKENATVEWRPSLEIFYTPDLIAPTAIVEYNPWSGSNTPFDVTATLTWFSETWVTITNNWWSNTYIFTNNGSFTFEFEDEAGNAWEAIATVDWIDKTYPIVQSTNPISWANNVSFNKTIQITFNTEMNTWSVESSISINPSLNWTSYNRSWDRNLIISNNGLDFDTNYTITIWTWAQNQIWNNIQSPYILSFSTIEEITLWYSTERFDEELNNSGTIWNSIIITLTGNTLTNDVISGNHITLSNIPNGLTWAFTRDNDTQITWSLIGTATNHADINDTWNLWISFDDWAFENYTSWDISNSNKNDFKIDFLDPYQTIQLYPTDDNTLDADTEPANWCDNGVCQEMNYGALEYGGRSDFGSKLIMKFDLSNISTWSKIYNANFRMTKMDLDIGTWFEIKQIINNPWWIEWNGSFVAATTWESNYKQRKRLEENWNNGNPWLVQWTDYSSNNTIVNPYFNTQWNETKTFNLNEIWIGMVQSWLDIPSTNQWFAIMNSDKNWVYIRTKERWTIAERPLLTINYIPDQTPPRIIEKCPLDNSINVPVTTNIWIQFDENIYAQTWYNFVIKKTSDDSTVQSIDVTSEDVNIDHNQFTITLDINNFESNTWYYVLIDSGALQDIAWNVYTGISNKTVWNFTTIDTTNIPEISWNYYTWVSNNSATIWWTINSIWSGTIIERGIHRSTIQWFTDGKWNKISEFGNWTNTWLFTIPINWLPSGTEIFFKTFAVNSYGTWYSSTQWNFITKPDTPIINISDISNQSFRVNRNTINWANSYSLYVSKNASFNNLITWHWLSTWITETTYTVDELEKETNYFAKLVAVNSGGDSLDSNIVNTTTTFTPNPTVRLKFEESVWAVAYDSAWTHDGILEWNPTKQKSGALDYAYAFDWIDDKATIVDFNYGPELSIYFRIKKDSANDDEHIFSHWAETDPNSINAYFDNTNQKLITSINGNTWAIAITWSDYTWLLDNERHMYVLTLDYHSVTGKVLSKIYIDWELTVSDSSITAPTNYDPTTNIVLWRRSQSPTAGTYYSGYLDEFKMYNQYLLEEEVQQLYLSTLDETPPTATVEYSPWSWQYTTSNVIATLTWFSETWVIITNNLGQDTYTFSENGSFVFEFKDPAGNTGETTATVTWIVTGTLDIWTPTEFTFTWDIRTKDFDQEFTWQFTWTDYFFVDDQLWLDAGYYTTISATDITWDTYSEIITSDNLFIKANWIQKLSWDDNSLVEINSSLNNYTPLSWSINYIFRNTASNADKKWKYGDQPYLKINLPSLTPADTYHWQIIFTLYEN